MQRQLHGEGAAELSADGELLGQSKRDRHQPKRDRQHHRQQPREPSADLCWTSTGGQLSGNGTSATLVATNADAGNTITVTGTATDDHNLSTSCTATLPCRQCRR